MAQRTFADYAADLATSTGLDSVIGLEGSTVKTGSAGGGYLVYVALLTQTGTSAPVATVLTNTLGGTVVWTRDGAGNYLGTLAGVFTANKTVCFATLDYAAPYSFLIFGRSDSDSVGMYLADNTTTQQDLNAGLQIEIRVYP